jgi:hypothetical protein
LKRFFEILFWSVVALIGVPVFGILIYTVLPTDHGADRQKFTPDSNLASAKVSELAPDGELAKMFSFFSDATEIQRAEKERQIRGKVVQWRLPVYNVTERSDFYVIQTKSRSGIVGAFCYVRASNADVKQYLLSLEEDDYVTCKGEIAGTTMRSIDIKPAVLLN